MAPLEAKLYKILERVVTFALIFFYLMSAVCFWTFFCALTSNNAWSDPLTAVATAAGVGLGLTGTAATVVGGTALVAGTALTASTLSEQKRAAKKAAAAQQVQFQNQMAAAEQQRQATMKQMDSMKQMENQMQVGRQMKRRAAASDATQTVLTPLGQNKNNTLGS